MGLQATSTAKADQEMRRFKKKTHPWHIKPDYVLPAGTYGTPGITLKGIAHALRVDLKLIKDETH